MVQVEFAIIIAVAMRLGETRKKLNRIVQRRSYFKMRISKTGDGKNLKLSKEQLSKVLRIIINNINHIFQLQIK